MCLCPQQVIKKKKKNFKYFSFTSKLQIMPYTTNYTSKLLKNHFRKTNTKKNVSKLFPLFFLPQ